MLGAGYPPFTGDPGGGPSSWIDGTFTGRTLPRFMDPKDDHGDLVVLRLEPATGTKLPDHPFTLRKSIELRVKGKIEGAISEARGQAYALKVRSKHQIERLLSMTELSDGTSIKVSKHPGLNYTRCVINCTELAKIDDDEILQNLEAQKVTGIRRIKRKIGDKRENTATVILTIEGTSMPEHIDVGYRRYRTRPYYPAPMLCFKCYTFGHTSARCQQKDATCGNCGQQHEIIKDVPCTNPPFCTRCKSNDHAVGSRKCPVYQTEDAIQHIRVDQNLLYPAARRLYETMHRQTTYASTTALSKDQTIQAMTKTMEEKDAKIKALETQIAAGPSTVTSTEIDDLRNLIFNLQKELKNKDERIKALESSQNGESRMDLVRKHGTIEDLIARVSNLEQTVSKKDKEIEILRKINEGYRRDMYDGSQSNLQREEIGPQKPTQTSGNQSVNAVSYPFETASRMEQNIQPESQGAKKKTRVAAPQQSRDDVAAKRIKNGNTSPETLMYISDTENTEHHEQMDLTSQSLFSEFNFSSDESTPDKQDVLMSP